MDARHPHDLPHMITDVRKRPRQSQRNGARFSASHGDDGVTHFHSGTMNTALPWTSTLLQIKRKIEAFQGRYNYRL